MTVFIAIAIFAVSLFLYFRASRVLKSIKKEVFIKEAREEMDDLITAFNRTAVSNIELLETKIGEAKKAETMARKEISRLQSVIDEAKSVVFHADSLQKVRESEKTRSATQSMLSHETIAALEKPMEDPKPQSVQTEIKIVSSGKKIVEKLTPEPFSEEIPEEAIVPASENEILDEEPESEEASLKTILPKNEMLSEEEPVEPESRSPLSRSDLLKKLLSEGTSHEELIGMGFLENEINLLSFLVRKK